MSKTSNSFSVHGAPYWPWSSFFRKVARSEVLVILDEVPMTNGLSYFNRCKLRSNENEFFLTVPLVRTGNSVCLRKDVRIHRDDTWRKKHIKSVSNTFAKAPYSADIIDILCCSLSMRWCFLIDMNVHIIEQIIKYADVKTEVRLLSELDIAQTDPTVRLLEIADKLQKKTYVSGDGSINYLNFGVFSDGGIGIQMVSPVKRTLVSNDRVWHDTGLSCLDELCHLGPQTDWRV